MKSNRQKKPQSYIERNYRAITGETGLRSCLVKIKDSDLQIFSDLEVSEIATDLLLRYRLQIETHIKNFPEFEHALTPLKPGPAVPPLIEKMLRAAMQTGTGPMAAVAGGIAEYVGVGLLRAGCREVIVENGGDLFLSRIADTTVAIFAGTSPLTMRVGVRIKAENMPIGVCTSSGTVGHSLSFGAADSVTVLAKSTLVADAAATRLGNEIDRASDGETSIRQALEMSRLIDGLDGVIVIRGERIGAVGEVELVPLG